MDKVSSVGQQRFLDLCRHHHLKITPQRIAIYQRLMEAEHHPSAEDVYEAVLPDYPNISFDTVYRTLSTFAEIGLTSIVEGFGKARRFDANLDLHHHFHCEKCGAILDFTYPDFDKLSMPRELEEKFEVRRKRVVLTGLCEKCSKK
ncbi:transcriptional repressor [bacterium]|nr:transcriptional repressor [bacterium]MBU1882427.1 transcriptional repressor [bacterium]